MARWEASGNADILTHWFELLKREMDLAGVTAKPQNIYNVDETGFVTDPSSAYVLARRGSQNVYQSTGGSGREQVTVCITGNAAGLNLPPMIVYKGKHLYKSWCEGGPERARFAVTDHGWMEKIVFLDYFTNLFLPESARLSDMTSPRLLIFDGHTSHVSLSLAVKAKENDVVLLRLPSHLTHDLQPLDKAVFGEVKKQWRTRLRCHARVRRDKITKADFPQRLKSALDAGLKSKNIISGFESTGIYPLNPRHALERVKTNTPFTAEPPSNPTEEPPSIPLTTPPPVSPAMPLPVSAALASTSTVVNPACLSENDESAAQIILNVETIPGSNILNITNVQVSRHESSSRPSTSSNASPTSNTGIKEYFLKRILPQEKAPAKKRQRISNMKYGESLTSEEALDRLNKNETKKLNKQKQEKKKTKGANNHKEDGKTDENTDIHDVNEATSDADMTVERDTYYAVMFTKPAAYYIARVLNESTPPEGETSYVMKFLNRGPNNTYHLPSREKVEDVERKFILCRANLEGAGPFYLRNHTEVETAYKLKLKMIKSAH